GTWETLRITELRRDPKREVACHTASEPTPEETQTQVGRNLNEPDAGSTTATGRRGRTKAEPPKIRRESDPLIVCAEQRVIQEGSSPSGDRMRITVSKSGGNASLAEEKFLRRAGCPSRGGIRRA